MTCYYGQDRASGRDPPHHPLFPWPGWSLLDSRLIPRWSISELPTPTWILSWGALNYNIIQSKLFRFVPQKPLFHNFRSIASSSFKATSFMTISYNLSIFALAFFSFSYHIVPSISITTLATNKVLISTLQVFKPPKSNLYHWIINSPTFPVIQALRISASKIPALIKTKIFFYL